MARRQHRPSATMERDLAPHRRACWGCGHPLWMLYHTSRTVTTVEGVCHLTLTVRRCVQPTCPLYRRPYRPEEETAVALPHGAFGLDVIALIGTLRDADHRSVPEIHRALQARGIPIAARTVTYLIERYEELVTVRLADQARLRDRLQEQGRVVLALDGLQPDKGHEVLWVLRDVLSGEVLRARSLLGATADDVGGPHPRDADRAPGADRRGHLRRARVHPPRGRAHAAGCAPSTLSVSLSARGGAPPL